MSEENDGIVTLWLFTYAPFRNSTVKPLLLYFNFLMRIHLFPPWHQYSEDMQHKCPHVDEPGTGISSTTSSFNSDLPCPVKVTTTAAMTPSVREKNQNKSEKLLWASRSSLYSSWHFLANPISLGPCAYWIYHPYFEFGWAKLRGQKQ